MFNTPQANISTMPRLQRRLKALLAASLGALTLVACSGSGSGGGSDPDPGTSFAVVSSNVLDGSVWQLNRAIDVVFSEDVDFSTVSLSTIQIIDSQGGPAIGSFTAAGPRTVRFQPVCPTNDSNSNGGLKQGRSYSLRVLAENAPGVGGGVTVLSTSGGRLDVGLNISFTTPESTDPLILFVDVVAGPPQVRVRGLNGEPVDSTAASFVEFGNGTQEYFAFDALTQLGGISGDVPLNLYSDLAEQFAVVLRFNQPVFAASTNVNSSLIEMQYSYNEVNWSRVPSSVSLIDNCTETGSSLRVTPGGVVPQGAFLRIVVREGFQDLTGDSVQATQANFARMISTEANPGAGDPGAGSDEVLEPFTLSGTSPGSLEDTAIASALPRANWSSGQTEGTLEASFDFDGTGGPGGDFDWYIRTGETIFLNTSGDQIIGGPNGDPFFTQPVFNGVVDVNDLVVEAGGKLVIQGPNTCTILATGSVVIRGEVSLDGGDNAGVGTLNTTNQPEEGAEGQAGGGAGGAASFLTSQSTPRGGAGEGAFGIPGLGGGGGETTYAPAGTCSIENRRGAGGGGGRTGADVRFDWQQGAPTGLIRCQTLVGMDAEPGFTGCPDSTGAVSQSGPAAGGTLAPSPFLDERDDNDFLGTLLTSNGQQILGELTGVIAGSGGGGGGDASRTNTFPQSPFNPTGDEKGSGGGGGAGGLLVLAIGNIEIRGDGELSANGGDGGGGENSIFFDRIGGGSGGGSGGHIVLSSAGAIIIESEATAASVGSFYLDDGTVPVHETRPLRALGGQGGCGKDSRCGANENGSTQWRQDAVPIEHFEGNTTIPPQNQNIWLQCNAIDACATIQPPEGTVIGGGGDGGPGIIQLHVSDPATQLQFPNAAGTYGVDLDPTRSMAPPPLGWTSPTQPADVLIPFFSARSEAFSVWIPLGLARLNPDGTSNQVELLFDGTDPIDGSIGRVGTVAAELPAIFPFTAIPVGGGLPAVDSAAATFTFPGAGFDDIYRLNPALTREFAIRIEEQGSGNTAEFLVQSGSYNDGTGELALTVDPRGAELADTLVAFGVGNGDVNVEVVPFFYRLRTGGVEDAFPLNTSVQLSFDATVENPLTGEPSAIPTDSFSNGDLASFATDISALNASDWDFFRFKAVFNLDVANSGVDLSGARPGLEFLRVQYKF
ncbi:MAG: hypothetical protein P8R46_04575 [Planctomycetota bacterium]|nr:hypothetical protein [Planctomycetota bacterium]